MLSTIRNYLQNPPVVAQNPQTTQHSLLVWSVLGQLHPVWQRTTQIYNSPATAFLSAFQRPRFAPGQPAPLVHPYPSAPEGLCCCTCLPAPHPFGSSWSLLCDDVSVANGAKITRRRGAAPRGEGRDAQTSRDGHQDETLSKKR